MATGQRLDRLRPRKGNPPPQRACEHCRKPFPMPRLRLDAGAAKRFCSERCRAIAATKRKRRRAKVNQSTMGEQQ